MELELIRTYLTKGTNGDIFHKGELVCHCLELAWLHNKKRVSCIPEGRYELRKRYSLKHRWHIEVMNVAERERILMHAANDAGRELEGCIAPVSLLTGEGKGLRSRLALGKVKALVYKALARGVTVFLIIKKSVK